MDIKTDDKPKEIDTKWQEFPTCPYCGYTDEEWWDGLQVIVSDGTEWNSCCANCGKEFEIIADLTVSFTTTKAKAECKGRNGE